MPLPAIFAFVVGNDGYENTMMLEYDSDTWVSQLNDIIVEKMHWNIAASTLRLYQTCLDFDPEDSEFAQLALSAVPHKSQRLNTSSRVAKYYNSIYWDTTSSEETVHMLVEVADPNTSESSYHSDNLFPPWCPLHILVHLMHSYIAYSFLVHTFVFTFITLIVIMLPLKIPSNNIGITFTICRLYQYHRQFEWRQSKQPYVFHHMHGLLSNLSPAF